MRQLSFAFIRAGQHIARDILKPTEAPGRLGAEGVVLRRIDLAKNMARFYSMEVERDLLGRVVLVRRWGRIGSAGKTRLDEHVGEGEAMAALQVIQSAKRRKGYQPVAECSRADFTPQLILANNMSPSFDEQRGLTWI